MDAKKLAAHLARKLFEIGDDGPERRAVRLQYKTGSLTNERDGGGLIESSLARFLEHELERLPPETNECPHTSLKYNRDDTGMARSATCNDCGELL